MSPLLSVEHLSVEFQSGQDIVPAVRKVNLAVGAGEVLGIVGESGSGKSVTCRAILGLLPPHARVSGRINFDGRNLAALSADELKAVRGRSISMIFQNPASHLDPLMRIGDQIAEPLRLHRGLSKRMARIEAQRFLEEVQIRDAAARMDAYPHQLSGGMKQRVLIAAALACQPRVLLADEPTTALDVTVQAEILKLLKELIRDHGLTMIFVSHDLGVIAEICDNIVVMRHGEVVERGAVSDVVGNPRHDYTRLLIESNPGRLKLLTEGAGTTEPLVRIEGLKVSFAGSRGLSPLLRRRSNRVRAVDGVSFDIKAGECFGVVGESGSGKSTIARSIVRLVEATEGRIDFAGRAIADLNGRDLLEYRRSVQMIFQNPYGSLNPRMSVKAAISEPIWRHGIADRQQALAKADDLMAMVELSPDLASRKPRQLSGGQCQRVGIARALGVAPRLLIADEVTSALDVTIQAQILELLARLRRLHNLTIMYVSHDLAVVRKFCDRIAVFRDGHLIELGATERVFSAPESNYTRALIAAAPVLDRAVEEDL